MLPLSSALLAALTFLSWPSGPHPWLWLLTTSPTELQIGQHTMPQILIHQHNALTSHTPSLLFNTLTTSPLPIPSFSFPLIHSLRSFNFLKLSQAYLSSLSDLVFLATCGDWWADNRNHLPPYSGAGAAQAGRARAHKATAERNKGCVLHHSNRGHSDSCLRHAHTDKRPEKQMVCAFMTSLVEAQESPPFKGKVFVSYSIIKLFSLVEN